LLVIGLGVPHLLNLPGGVLFENAVLLALVGGISSLAILATGQFFATSLPRKTYTRRFSQLSRDFSHTLFNNKWVTTQIFFWSTSNHICRVIIVILLALGLGLDLALQDALVLVPSSLLIAMLPISLSGWGVREIVFIEAFGSIGMTASNALALSILYGVVMLLTGLMGGVIWAIERALMKKPNYDRPSNASVKFL
jgi:uncharacterized membrane protein YbhN (UPF0104 family)